MVKPRVIACGVAVSAICALSACTTLQVTSDVNTAVKNAVQCHTFAWAGSFHGSSDTLRSSVANPVNESRLRSAIEANLRTVGVQPVSGVDAGTAPEGAASGADCLVGYGIGMRNVIEGDPYGYGWGGWGWGWGWGPGFVGGGWGWDYPYVYHEGIIAVDLYDARSRQPLWHASVNQSLSGATGEKADQKIQAAVAAIFTKYPR